MAENTETTIETTVETVNTTEETPLTANPRIRDVSQLQTLVCFHSTPPLYCLPFADLELFVNGGFETGDFTGWDNTQCDLVTNPVHSGVYSAHLYESFMSQDFPDVPRECIEAFQAWAIGSPYNWITIFYDDDTSTYLGVDWLSTRINESTWSLLDLLSAVPLGKKIVKVQFNGGTGNPWWIDDCTLKGKGM